MRHDAARLAFKKSCVLRHILVLMDDTLRAILICIRSGGRFGNVDYPKITLPGDKEDKVLLQLAEVKRWLDCALLQSNIDREKGYALSKRERDLVNAKIRRVNRWALEQKVPMWREIILTLAALNMALFHARMMLGDTPHRRMVYIEADKLCLLLGDGNDFLLSADMFDACRDSLLDGMPGMGMRSEEDFFFSLLAMPGARNEMEEAMMAETGKAASASSMLAMEGI